MDIEIKKFQKIFKELLEGKSLRKLEEEYGINRESIVKKSRELFPEGSEEAQKFEMILEYNKKNNQTKNIDSEKMKVVAKKLFAGKISMKDAYTELNIDKLTFKEKLAEYVINSNDKELKKEYIEYETERKPDYSHINFKALLIEMIETNLSQVEIGQEYGIPARRIGREVEKLKEDKEYNDLYVLCKEHAKRKLRKEEFSIFEKEMITRLLGKYEDRDIIIRDAKTKEELQYENACKIVEIAENVNGTLEEKAQKAGVSESTLRRMKKLVENHKQIDER